MSSSFRFRAFVTLTAIAAVGALWLSTRADAIQATRELVVLTVLTVLAESLAVTLPNGTYMSLSYPLSVAAIMLLGPTGGALVATLSGLPRASTPGRHRLGRFVFNVCQVAVAAVVAGWVYRALGGRSLLERALGPSDFPSILLPVLALVSSSLVMNYVFVGLYYLVRESTSLRQFWRSTISWTLATQVALGLVGMAIAQVMAAVGLVGLTLFAVPLMIARQTYQRFGSLRQAYADTVRSLVAAIEAKDPYTKGHSVRVAEYAVAAGRTIGMTDHAVDRLEYAALLHDVGKVGISRAVLAKPSALTAEEYSTIKRHPEIGARILDSVPHLEDIVPIVRHHHERFDGAGYSTGLSGEEIPIAARVLAVADSFDAMTSRRPYREALQYDSAVAELLAGAGSQYDAAIVEAFLRALPDVWQPEADGAQAAEAESRDA